MKTPFLPGVLLAALLLTACDPYGDRLCGYRSRSDCGPHGPGGAPERSTPGALLPDTLKPFTPDTTLLFSAVRFPEGYDWQRDTAYGSVSFELLLYKDFACVLTLPSGADACFVPDADRHHLLDGHLYTERMADGETRIGRDGVEIFRFPGREYLVGLLEDGEDLYTLSRPAKGPGFSYRKNGEPLLVRTDGAPFGDLTDPAYRPTGALYLDQGERCFCFSSGSGDKRLHFTFRDEQETQVEDLPPGAPVLDLRVHRGDLLVLQDVYRGHRLAEGRLWPEAQGFGVTGRFADEIGAFSGYLMDAAAPTRVCREEATLYRTSRGTFAVSADAGGDVRWYGPTESGRETLPCHFPTPACATFVGRTPWLALTPRDTRQRPFVRDGKRVREVEINGYISSLSVTFSRRPK